MVEKRTIATSILRRERLNRRFLLLDRGDDVEMASVRVEVSSIETGGNEGNKISAPLMKESE
jgi:hypothetical protein